MTVTMKRPKQWSPVMVQGRTDIGPQHFQPSDLSAAIASIGNSMIHQTSLFLKLL